MELTAPIVPVPPNTPNENFLKGFALMSAVNERRNQLYINMEKMKNQATANQLKADQQIRDEQDKTKHWADVASSTDRLRTIQEANYNLNKDTLQGKLDKTATNTEKLINYQSDLNAIDAPLGTQEWQSKAELLKNDYGDVTGTPEGQRIWKQFFDPHKFAARERRSTANDLMSNYYKNLSQNGLSDYAFANPTIWGSNKDGSKFLAVDPTGLIVKPDAKAARYITLKPKEYDLFKQQHDSIKDILAGNSKPADIPKQGRVRVKAPDGTIGNIPIENLDDAKTQGYSEMPPQ